MNTAQTQAAKAKLDIDLSTAETGRLIELCLLHRANPKASETFPARLKSELERRFTPSEIAAEDTMFAVLQHFANQFQSAIPMLAVKLREMAATVNRDIWFTDNKALFVSALNDREVMQWLVSEHEILVKVLNNQIALPLVAQSETAATVILTDPDALALWKNARNLWAVWPQHAQGMAVLAKSAELVQYVIDDTARLNAVIASTTAMNAVAASAVAMNAVAASAVAMNAVIASSTAMNAVAASSTAMNAVAAQEPALRAIVNSESARNALIANNDKLQAVREAMYNTVKNVWTKKVAGKTISVSQGQIETQTTPKVATPAASLVFAYLGIYPGYTSGKMQMLHADNSVAGETLSPAEDPISMIKVSVVGFGGSKFKSAVNYGMAFAEQYVPN